MVEAVEAVGVLVLVLVLAPRGAVEAAAANNVSTLNSFPKNNRCLRNSPSDTNLVDTGVQFSAHEQEIRQRQLRDLIYPRLTSADLLRLYLDVADWDGKCSRIHHFCRTTGR